MPSPVDLAMKRNAALAGSILAALLTAALLQGCRQQGTAPSEPTSPSGPAPAATGTGASDLTPTPGPPAGYTDGEGVNEGYPDLTPPSLTGEAEKGEAGARNILLYFARAIELKEFDQAWAMLSPGDREKWPKAEFTRMFADLGRIAVAMPGGTVEGGAGSLYYSSPISITASDKAGRPVRYEGEAVVRRVNDVDGATAAQLRWHFDRLTLDWTH